MIQIANTIVYIDSATSIIFFLAFLVSLRKYNKTVNKANLWLIIGITFAFLSIISITNVLEWSGITSALDSAEDFINILVTIIWSYLFFNLNKTH